jgi:hypothetical protein
VFYVVSQSPLNFATAGLREQDRNDEMRETYLDEKMHDSLINS